MSVVVVTGAAQGIGRAVAHRFAADGARVVVADLQGEKAGAVAEELPGDAIALEVDVSDRDSAGALVERALDRFGSVDVLVNCAAIFATITMKPFEELTPHEWRRMLDVNLTGTFFCCQAVAAPMRAQGHGRIVNVSSATVLLGRPFYAHYVSSKAGVVGLTRALARELGPAGITINVVMPGSTETEVPRDTVTPEQAARLIDQQSIKRRGQADDVVGAIAFLASDDARFMTGQTVVVDGGLNFI